MKTKILFSLLVIVITVSMVVGGTLAWFTDSDTSAENTFTAGSLDIVVAGDMPITMTNIAPGDTVAKNIIFKNPGSLDMIFRAYITDVIDQVGSLHMANYMTVKVTIHPSEVADNDAIYDGYIPYGPVDSVVYAEGPISGITNVTTFNNIDASFGGFPLKHNQAALYKFEITFSKSMPNDFQNFSYKAKLHTDSTQFKNQVNGSVVW